MTGLSKNNLNNKFLMLSGAKDSIIQQQSTKKLLLDIVLSLPM
jgi:hypothetical protein